jgi:hypothetical protein
MVRAISSCMIYCIIDGLDECGKTFLDVLLKRLRELFATDSDGDAASTCRFNMSLQPDNC